jgi:O-antigen/teichoic acid export membrane protein
MSDESNVTFSRLFASGGIIFVGMIFHLGLGFLARLVIARLIGPIAYGGVTIGIALLTTASALVVIGTDTGIGRFLPRYDDPSRRRGVLVSAYQVVIPFSVIVGIAVAVLAGPIAEYVFHDPTLTPIIRIFGMTIPFGAFVKLTVGSVRGMQQALPRVYIRNITLPLVRFTLVAVVVLLGFGVIGISWAYAAAYGTATALSVYYLVRHTSLFSETEATGMHRELLVFSAPLMITATMGVLFQNIDVFVIGYFFPRETVAVYTAVYPLATLLTTLLIGFSFVFMPTISELQSNGEYERMHRTYRVVCKWIFLASLPIFLVFVSYPELVIRYTFGPKYVEGSLALAILAIGFFSHSVAGPSGDTLTALGRPQDVMYINILVASVNAVLNLILVPRYSFVGAAVASAIGFILMNGLYLVQLYRKNGMHPLRSALLRPAMAAGTLWVAGYWLVGTLFTATLPVVIVQVLVFLPLYGFCVLRFGGIEREELALLGTFEERTGLDLDAVRAVAKRFAG